MSYKAQCLRFRIKHQYQLSNALRIKCIIKHDVYDLVCHVATEVIDGLGYLHNQRIAHRDLKTANILVSNQHYYSLSLEDEEFGPTYETRPIACKLSDCGESRSRFIQTQAIIASKH